MDNVTAHRPASSLGNALILCGVLLVPMAQLTAQRSDSTTANSDPGHAIGISVGSAALGGGEGLLVGFKVVPVRPDEFGVDFGISIHSYGGRRGSRYASVNLGLAVPFDADPIVVVARGGFATIQAFPFTTYLAVGAVIPLSDQESTAVRIDLVRRSSLGGEARTGLELGFAWMRP